MNVEITLTVKTKGGETDRDAALTAQAVLSELRGSWPSSKVTKVRKIQSGWLSVKIDDVNSLTLSELRTEEQQ